MVMTESNLLVIDNMMQPKLIVLKNLARHHTLNNMYSFIVVSLQEAIFLISVIQSKGNKRKSNRVRTTGINYSIIQDYVFKNKTTNYKIKLYLQLLLYLQFFQLTIKVILIIIIIIIIFIIGVVCCCCWWQKYWCC